MWEVRAYASGTMTVQDMEAPTKTFKYGVLDLSPWFYVYGPGNEDEDQWMRDRWKVCEDLCDYMNGGQRPAWIDDMERISEVEAIALDGTSITATGPMVDRDPPNCNWDQDRSVEAVNARARLMDRLFGVAQCQT